MPKGGNRGWLEVWDGTRPDGSRGEVYLHPTRHEGEACVRRDPEPSRLYRINEDLTIELAYENRAARDQRHE